MTKSQKKIQKSSHILKILFLCLLLDPLMHMAQKLLFAVGLLCDHAPYVELLRQQTPNVTSFHGAMFNFAGLLCYALLFAAYYLTHCIFRDISQEYTPFRAVHTRRLRWIAGLIAACLIFESVLNHWAVWANTGILDWPFRLDVRYILPLLIFSFSFILDYACQLQAEADTTL